MTPPVLLRRDRPPSRHVWVLKVVLSGHPDLGHNAVLHAVLDCRQEISLVLTSKDSQAVDALKRSLKCGASVLKISWIVEKKTQVGIMWLTIFSAQCISTQKVKNKFKASN